MIDWAFSAAIQVFRLQNFKVFLAFTQAFFLLMRSDTASFIISASSLSFFLLKFLDKMFRKLGDGVDSFTVTKNGLFLDLEGRNRVLVTLSLYLVVLLESAGLKSLGKIMLNLGDKSLLDVDNKLRLTIFSLELQNFSILVEDLEGRFQPRLERSGNLFLLSMSLLRHPVLVHLHIFIIIANKSGILKFQGASAVMLGLNSYFSGKSYSRVLAVQLRNTSQHLGGVLVFVFLVWCPAVGLDSSSNYTSHQKESGD